MKKLFIPILLLILACTDDEDNPCVYEPTLTTEEVTDITESTATFNGVIKNTSENCETPNNIEQGFVYSTEPQPTLEDMKVNVNRTTISTAIENLEPDTSYYMRTFLTNSFGEFYGNEVSFTTNEPNTVPDAPSLTNVSAGDGQVDITFDAPANDGGSTISEYTATSSPGNISSTISQAEGGTITVKGLTNGTTYSFTVTATNGVGTSSPSNASNSVTPLQAGNYPEDTVHCDPSNPTVVVDVTSPETGRIWMDRNLGARRVAKGIIDDDARGSLYQWGRGADGHQCENSEYEQGAVNIDQPNEPVFYTEVTGTGGDWRYPSNDNLWKEDGTGVNNPCPSGYRLPTKAEWYAEINSWTSKDYEGAFDSALKLPVTGYRALRNGGVYGLGLGYYWSSTTYVTSSRNRSYQITIDDDRASSSAFGMERQNGLAVRCIKH
jgi:uncharacterized protein (TIGR02145 family)